MGPAQLSQQRCDNLLVGKLLGELHHPAQVLLAEAAPELGFQVLAQRRDELRTILGPLAHKDVPVDACAHLPIKLDLHGINDLGGLPAHRPDQIA